MSTDPTPTPAAPPAIAPPELDARVPFHHPIAGHMEGYYAGRCGHRVASIEWRAGFRVCERCDPAEYPDPVPSSWDVPASPR